MAHTQQSSATPPASSAVASARATTPTVSYVFSTTNVVKKSEADRAAAGQYQLSKPQLVLKPNENLAPADQYGQTEIAAVRIYRYPLPGPPTKATYSVRELVPEVEVRGPFNLASSVVYPALPPWPAKGASAYSLYEARVVSQVNGNEVESAAPASLSADGNLVTYVNDG